MSVFSCGDSRTFVRMNPMRPIEQLCNALGQLAYAVARTDGEVQKAERQKFCEIVAGEMEGNNYNFDIASVIFQMMDKDQVSTEDSYRRAMDQIRRNCQYLSPSLKATFIRVMEKIAEAYPPVTVNEELLLNRFKRDIAAIEGNPFYSSTEVKE